ncbi:MAG: DNA polymerase III subunit gamma/tau [Acidithiobacillales bacterium SG8_45]|jgi:DNA polymerase-3 subunit gamma/tau|nr:MAG: DNA polymerase III subunit gamma/tau [Acidithiobacillales bacterium SG8_45]
MSYQVLARKWRPHSFEELVGQQHVVKALVNALDNDRLHHAFLFTGTRGVGKTTIARILAKSLNCEEGVSSKPCGKCRSCVEVDEGRFVDLIEVDAASRTKVDETRELLDNVQYAPTRGRYKVYLIDEVHMLSAHSFNALLKTLEEPPPHVKFLLATTDPQKLPVTVLSRCLQFNLMHLQPELIEAQLKKILDAEKIAYDESALALLARSAEGSMRDGLSLMDQAIAYGGGEVREEAIREMLGTIDRDTVWRMLAALAASDARALMKVVSDIAERGMDYRSVLEELLIALHRVAMAQVDAALVASLAADEKSHIESAASGISPEDAQLFYQIGITGRRDLPLAPNPRSGLEMVLLRMLAFRPVSPEAIGTAPVSPPVVAKADSAPPVDKKSAAPKGASPLPAAKPVSPASTWSGVVSELPLSGINQQLANNTLQDSFDGAHMVLTLDETFANLHNRERETALKSALDQYYGKPIRLELRVGKPAAETPAAERQRQVDEKQQAAVAAIENDPNIATIQEQFNARVKPDSIRPNIETGE